ncbi:MAG: N-acetylmuramoyl-L-alanine amidase [Pseudomonadota bacterium]
MSFAAVFPRAILVLLAWAATLASPAAGQIDGVRIVGDGQVTRVTLWSAGPIAGEVLVSEAAGASQILLALDEAVGRADGPRQPVSAATGVASYGWERGALSLTLARPMMVSRRLDLPPAGEEGRHRLVIDLVAVSRARFTRAADRAQPRVTALLAAHRAAAAGGRQAARPTPDGREVVLDLPPEAGRYLVVIDPGHGGRDPGAIAPSGLQEKDVVLSAARALRDRLEATDRFTVRLTRADDTFIELGQRVTLARDWGADLFISIHADAATDAGVAGASVYTISERGQRRVGTEAQRNNWDLDVEEGVSEEVSGILETLTLRETRTNSGRFAQLLLPELAKAGPVLRNTHRKAGFYVLLAPDVPAVLLEMGFLTNTADADRLAKPAGRAASMDAVAAAIETYFNQQDVIFASN